MKEEPRIKEDSRRELKIQPPVQSTVRPMLQLMSVIAPDLSDKQSAQIFNELTVRHLQMIKEFQSITVQDQTLIRQWYFKYSMRSKLFWNQINDDMRTIYIRSQQEFQNAQQRRPKLHPDLVNKRLGKKKLQRPTQEKTQESTTTLKQKERKGFFASVKQFFSPPAPPSELQNEEDSLLLTSEEECARLLQTKND